MKKEKTRTPEIIAIVIFIMLIVAIAIIPQHFSSRALKKIKVEAEHALDCIDNPEKLLASLKSIQSIIDKHDELLHFLYPHSEVTELELATLSALQTIEHSPDEVGNIVSALCNIISQSEVLQEIEHVSIKGVL